MTPLSKSLKGIFKQMRRFNDAQEMDKPIPKHEIYGNRSERIGIWVNGFLALLTLLAIWMAYQSNKSAKEANLTSKNALDYAKHKDSFDNIEQEKKDVIAEQERIANRQYIDSTLWISMQGINLSKRSSEVAEKNLRENIKSFEFNRRSIISQNRSYVGIVNLEMETFATDSLIRIIVNLKNSGITPAYNTNITCGFVLGQTEIRLFEKSFDNNIYGVPITFISGGENISFPQTVVNIFEGGTGVALERKYVYLFVLTTIKYSDVYGLDRMTRLLSRYDVTQGKFIASTKFYEAK